MLSGSRFCSEHVLLSGPKFQNTNCTNIFSTAVTRQPTSGRLRAGNNTIVKCFSNSGPWQVFHFSNHVQVLMVCIPSTTQAAKFSWAKNISSDLHCNDSTNLLSLATPANAYLMSILSIVNTVWTYRNLQPHSPIKPDWSDLRDLLFRDLGCLPFDRKIRLGCQKHNRFTSLPQNCHIHYGLNLNKGQICVARVSNREGTEKW